MGDLSLFLFISFASPLLLTLIVLKGKAKTMVWFLLFGMIVCLFSGAFSGFLLGKLSVEDKYFTENCTPFFEEIFKAVPIIAYSFSCAPKKRTLLECSILVGVGFAVLENAFILANSFNSISLIDALFRGFGAGLLHALCSLLVGYCMTFVQIRKKLFYTGTFAILVVVVLLHSIYNSLAQSGYIGIAVLLPAILSVPILILLKKNNEA